MASIGEQVECLRLDIGVVQGNPLEVFLGQLGVCRLAGLLAHGLDGVGTILRFLSAGDGGQAGGCQQQGPTTHSRPEGGDVARGVAGKVLTLTS